MSKVEIDFNDLKYNLYEILNISPDSDENKIRKTFMKLVKTFHPDRNCELEQDIYYHLILSSQILLNKGIRRKYDLFLESKVESFNELKQSFNKTLDNIQDYFPKTINESKQTFTKRINELNNKHGYNPDDFNDSINERYNKVKNSREYEIKIEKEFDIRTPKDFNNKFDSYRENGKLKDQIIEYKSNGELSTYSGNIEYTSLRDLDKLYIEDTITSNNFTSLDRAFSLQPVIKTDNKTIKERLDEYEHDTEYYKNKNLFKK